MKYVNGEVKYIILYLVPVPTFEQVTVPVTAPLVKKCYGSGSTTLLAGSLTTARPMSKAKKAAKDAQEAKNAAASAAGVPPSAAAVPAAKLKAEVEEMQQRLKSLKEAVEDRDSSKDERLRKSNVVKEDDEDVMEDENLEDGNEDGEEYPDYPDQPTFRSVSCLSWTFLSSGSVTFWYVSESADPCYQITDPDPESGSYSSLLWYSRCQHKILFLIFVVVAFTCCLGS
jgi:hypothetical protein